MVNNNIAITVDTQYLPEQSEPQYHRFAFGYTITITNNSTTACRLISRHWIITDANGKVQQVQGEGVVGEQPLIYPGRSFRYSSGALLPTPVGTMHGSYKMINDKGNYFDATIPVFRLALPELVN